MGEAVVYRGGCLCGALRYAAVGAPLYAGHCYCADCRKASGSGFVPFMGFAAGQFTVNGAMRGFVCTAATGGPALRNFCAVCGSLMFGGEVGRDEEFTVYARSLDEPAVFQPSIAIFTEGRPDWAVVPEGLKVFARMPR